VSSTGRVAELALTAKRQHCNERLPRTEQLREWLATRPDDPPESLGRVRAYAHCLMGISQLATVSGLGGVLWPDVVATDEHSGDGGFAWSTRAGLSLPILSDVALDLGVAYQ